MDKEAQHSNMASISVALNVATLLKSNEEYANVKKMRRYFLKTIEQC